MFGLGPMELVVILALALIIFGPSKLVEITKTLSKLIAEFKKASNEAKETIAKSLEEIKEEENKVASSEQRVAKNKGNIF